MAFDRIAHYRILDEIGAGGMGRVYRAEDTKLGRLVALKVLAEEIASDADHLARFQREARAVAALNHPNIVTLYSVEEADGISFLTMELVEGRSLDRLLPAQGLPLERLFALAIPIASAVTAAHERGVVHRDLKPSNVMVTEPGGQVKVLDFGLARPPPRVVGEGESQLETLTLTRTGRVSGTPSYMSPEQARGDPIDHRSDVFSLGVLLFELATGRRPFLGSNPAEVLSAVLRDPAPRLEEMRSGLPRQLGRILSRCLEKDRDERFQTARDVYNELRGVERELAEERSAAERTRSANRDGTPASGRRHRALWLALSALVLGLFAAVLFDPGGFWRDEPLAPETEDGPAPPVRSSSQASSAGAELVAPSVTLAVLPFENRSPAADADLASGLELEINARLSKASDLRVLSRSAVAAALRTGEELSELGAERVLSGVVQVDGNRIRIVPELVDSTNGRLLWSQAYDRELNDLFTLQSEVALAIAEALQAELAPGERARIERQSTNDLAAFRLYQRQARLMGNLPEENRLGIELLEEALSLDPDFTDGLARLAWRHVWEQRMGRRESIAAAHAFAESAIASDPESSFAHYAMASTLTAEGRFSAASREFRRAVELDPSDGAALTDGSFFLTYSGELDEALLYAVRAYQIEPNDATQRWHVAVPLLALGDDSRAEPWLRLALESFPVEAQPRNVLSLASLELDRGERVAAAERAKSALAMFEGQPEAELWAAVILADAGDVATSRPLLERHASVNPTLAAGDPFDLRQVRTHLAFVLWESGERERAKALFEASSVFSEEILAGGADSFIRQYELASIDAIQGRHDAAIGRLESMVDQGYRFHRKLANDRPLRSLREDERFTRLLERIVRDVDRMAENVEREGIAAPIDAAIERAL